MKKGRILIIGGSFVMFVSLFLYYSWDDLPFGGEKYGVSYNHVRVGLNLPIVEEYFTMTKPTNNFQQTWITPDSLKSGKVHLSKHFNTNGGEIVYEFDLFGKETDTVRYLLLREYFFEADSVAYQFKIDHGDTPFGEIGIEKGDSILNYWLDLSR